MSETREPGYYWVRRKSGAPWEIVLVHPYDERYDKKSGQAVDSMGWDAGACLPANAEWGPRILPHGEEPPQVRKTWPCAGDPALGMWADRHSDCRHGVLGCEMDDSGPVITCAGCGTKWRPAQ